MAFIQHGAAGRRRFRLTREKITAGTPVARQIRLRRERAVSSRERGAWRVGGLVGALVYSVVCWMAVYHGARTVIAWTKPTPTIEASVGSDKTAFQSPDIAPSH